MKQITFIAIAIFIATIMTACGQTSRYVPEGWKVFETRDFSILYPDTFELNTAEEWGFRFILLANQTSPDDIFRENVNLMVVDFSGMNLSFDEYVEVTEYLTKTLFIDGGSIIESKKSKVNDFEVFSIIFTGQQRLLDLKWKQHLIVRNEPTFNNDICVMLKWIQHHFVKNGTAYVLTFVAEQNQFDNYIEIATKIMDSFKIK